LKIIDKNSWQEIILDYQLPVDWRAKGDSNTTFWIDDTLIFKENLDLKAINF
jgi:hypothetical protein